MYVMYVKVMCLKPAFLHTVYSVSVRDRGAQDPRLHNATCTMIVLVAFRSLWRNRMSLTMTMCDHGDGDVITLSVFVTRTLYTDSTLG